MKKATAVLAVTAILVGGAAWLWSGGGGEAARPAELVLYGNVDIRQVELAFRVPGRIETMAFEEGDPVEAGTVVASLDAAPYRDELRMAEADVARAEAELAKLEAGTRREEIAQARAVVAEREAALENARRVLARRRDLVGTGAVSREAVDNAEAQYEGAQARLEVARRGLDLALEGFRAEDIAAGRAALEAARARRAAAETALSDTRIAAPADGTILTRVREPGAIAGTGQTVYTLHLARPVEVRAYVPEPDLGRVAPGTRVRVRTDSRPDRPYHGQIGFVAPVAEFTPRSVETPELRTDLVYRLRIVVEDPDQGLRQGMPVTVEVPLDERADEARDES